MDLPEFLASESPHVERVVSGAAIVTGNIKLPEIWIHCPGSGCSGVRCFRPDKAYVDMRDIDSIVDYSCSNCRIQTKTYALHFAERPAGPTVMKIGELPRFGPPTPTGVLTLVGPDRELFLKACRAENQGLGIGAYAYYRRIVENQWARFLAEILRVAKRDTSTPPEVVKRLETAAAEKLFNRAVEAMKDAIPASLRIEGHNPLTLLFDELSDKMHRRTDEECLEGATAIRVVLFELSERIAVALKDTAELRSALSALMKPKSPPKPPAEQPDAPTAS